MVNLSDFKTHNVRISDIIKFDVHNHPGINYINTYLAAYLVLKKN